MLETEFYPQEDLGPYEEFQVGSCARRGDTAWPTTGELWWAERRRRGRWHKNGECGWMCGGMPAAQLVGAAPPSGRRWRRGRDGSRPGCGR